MIIDTHLHLIDKSRLHYDWLDSEPLLNRDHTYAEYAREAHRCGIEGTLHMEVDVVKADASAETEFLREISRQPGSLIRGVFAGCKPEHEDFPAYLEKVKSDPFVKGLRRVIHFMHDSMSQEPVFRANIARLAGTGLSFDLCVLPRQMPQTIALVDLNPDVQFVLDHCGVPDIKGGGLDVWRGNVAEIAKRPNIIAKISGVVAYTGDEWGVETLRPYVEHTIESFGWDRVVWGSDWPVSRLGGGLSQWVAATHALIAGASADERAKLLSGNAKRMWKL